MVVANGAFKIDAELQIRAKPSMMSPAGGMAPPTHDHGQHSTPVAMEEMKPTSPANKQLAISESAREALTPLYDAYFAVQMALANDDLTASTNAFLEVEKQTSNVAMELFDGDSHMRWMAFAKSISESATIGKTADDFEKARDAFGSLSRTFIDMHNSFGHAGPGSYYLTFCPMAFDNQGAFWLQTVDTVYNSFYGDMMLRCGSIEDTLESTEGND